MEKSLQKKWTVIDGYKARHQFRQLGVFSHMQRPCVHVLTDEEREQVERLRWPSRGYLQELNEYQQRRRKLRKSRCTVM